MFFLVSTDHRFNPLVYLRAALTQEQEDLVRNGVSLTTSEQTTTMSGDGSCNGNGSGNLENGIGSNGTNTTGSNKRKLRRKRVRRGKKGGGGGAGKQQHDTSNNNNNNNTTPLKASATEFVPSH